MGEARFQDRFVPRLARLFSGDFLRRATRAPGSGPTLACSPFAHGTNGVLEPLFELRVVEVVGQALGQHARQQDHAAHAERAASGGGLPLVVVEQLKSATFQPGCALRSGGMGVVSERSSRAEVRHSSPTSPSMSS